MDNQSNYTIIYQNLEIIPPQKIKANKERPQAPQAPNEASDITFTPSFRV